MMLNEAAVKRIPDIGKIVVSIDHPHADEYRKIRRGGDLDLIISNLKELKKAKPQQWVCIQGLIMNSNIEYVEDFVRLAKEVSADSVKFIHPVIFDKAMNDIHIEPSEEINIKLNKARAYAAKAGIRFVAVPQMAKPRVCVEPWVGIRVSIKGYIYPCCYIDNSNGSSWKEWCRDVCLEIPQANYILGNVFDESARTIWNCEAFRLLRNRVVSSRSKKLIQVDRLNALRSKIDTSNRFSYCSVCLYRQNRSC
jgi:MoaA/NifB/PqqE/SkfB family radical SAM enzyme